MASAGGLRRRPQRRSAPCAPAPGLAFAVSSPPTSPRGGRRGQPSDAAVEGDEEAQRALRFAVYHLNGAVDPRSERVSIAARGLTGDGYMGHVFWDTDVFMLPFFVFTWPEAARSLLLYRHRTLPAAREKARRLGLSGALYAWESTD